MQPTNKAWFSLCGRLQVQLKPGAKRMQIDVPLHKESPNYNRGTDTSLQLDSIALVSSLIDMGTSHAAACVRCLPDHMFIMAPDL